MEEKRKIKIYELEGKYPLSINIPIESLLKIAEDAMNNGATHVEIHEGDSNWMRSSLFFYRLQTNEEYNAEIQEEINGKMLEVEKIKNKLI